MQPSAPSTPEKVVRFMRRVPGASRQRSVIRLPDYDQVARTRSSMRTPRASCTWNPIPEMRARWYSGTARSGYGSIRRDSADTDEMDWIYELPYRRRPHPSYGEAAIPPTR